MKRVRPVVTRNTNDLAHALRLSPADAVEMSLRRQLNDKIIVAVKQSNVTHAGVAKAAHISPGRLTAILNRNTSHASTSIMLRILTALGYRPKVTFVRERSAA
jgi:predicted XRE-type DNA-binding protein